jgi:predicted MFS family arabinose efflux permease
VAAFAISLLTLAIVPSEPTWLVVALIVLLAGIASGVVCGRTWAESFGYDRGRTTLGAILVAWLIGVLCGAMTIAPLLAAFAWFALRSL